MTGEMRLAACLLLLVGLVRGMEQSSILGDISSMYKTYQECAKEDLSSCLKTKLASSLGRAARAQELPLFPGASLVKRTESPEENLVENEDLAATLPRSLDERESALDDIIVNRASSLFDSHSLQLQLSSLELPGFGATQEEGRGKRRRALAAILLMFMTVAGTILPIKLGALALLAGKALIISKLALALAAIIGLKKLFSHHDNHETSYQVVSVPHGHHGHRRNFDAQNLAYRAYAPQPSTA